MVMDIKDIMNTIPHRSPFLLVDRIEEMEEGKRIVGKKCVTYNEPFCRTFSTGTSDAWGTDH